MTRRSQDQPRGSGTPGRWVLAGLAASAVLVGVLTWRFVRSSNRAYDSELPPPKPAAFVNESDSVVLARYAGSKSCRDCHESAYQLWAQSHHGLAERPVDPALDREAFDPPRAFRHGSQTSEARTTNGALELITLGHDGRKHAYQPKRVIGVFPLMQYLVPFTNGFWQCTELAWDPARKEWFDVYGDEDRKPGEWGHWTGRGMTWNFMCASCHNTRLRRHYDAATDTYHTTMVEPGVGCESCHGPLARHVAWQREHPQRGIKDPTVPRFSTNQILQTCGPCHSRRGELTGDFVPGDAYADHYALTIVDDTDIYYPDGQVRDEDYEYASFLSSRMWLSGVRCLHCHDPHSMKTKLSGDALCMQCHSSPTPPAPKIDPANHSFHQPGTEGDHCIECHMPITIYMQRHPRHDHGFTIPDPLLTKQFGIPNACGRCHTNQPVDWALEWVNKWYGQRMDRPTRARAQTLARARLGEPAAIPALIQVTRDDPIPLWRASASILLRRWGPQPDVTRALLDSLRDEDPLVRHMATRSLEPLVTSDRQVRNAVQQLLDDPVRLVRVQAAWALHATIDTNTIAGRDLMTQLRAGADHPAGAMQTGVFWFDRGQTETAISWFKRAIEWDPYSAPFRDTLAVALSQIGRPDQAVTQLEAACRVAPGEAIYRYRLGLALNEAGRLDDAVKALAETVKLEPTFAQAWYNLGLGYAQQNLLEQAIEALGRAEQLNPTSPQIPYALSTVLARLGRTGEAEEAARRAEKLRGDGR